MNKSVKGIQTINRFIKLLNGMPEKVQQDFYRKMAAKIEEGYEIVVERRGNNRLIHRFVKEDKKLKKYHIHIYKISGKLELDTFTYSEEGAKSGALKAAESGGFIFGKSDCKHIAIAFLIETDASEIVPKKVLGELEESIKNQPRRKIKL